MERIRYAVDGRDGFTAEFVTSREQAVEEAKRVAAEKFGNRPDTYEVWNLEHDQHVGGFKVEAA